MLTGFDAALCIVTNSLLEIASSIQRVFRVIFIGVFLCIKFETQIYENRGATFHPLFTTNLVEVHVVKRGGELLFLQTLCIDPVTHSTFNHHIVIYRRSLV